MKKEKQEKEIIFVEERGYYLNNGKIDNFNEVVDTIKRSKNRFYKKSNKFWTGFKRFIAKGSIVDIAVALAITAAFNVLVNSIISSFINPLVAIILGNHRLVDLKYVIKPEVVADEALGIAGEAEIAITYGVFLDALLSFIVITLTLYVFIRVFIKLKDALHFNEIKNRMKELDEEAKREEERKRQEQELAEQKALKEKQEREELINNIAEQTALLRDIKKELEMK